MSRTSATRDAVVTSVCGYCSTGCGLDVRVAGGAAVAAMPARHYPVNRGQACPKGWEVLTPIAAPDRATRPLVRSARGHLEPTSWDEAMRRFVAGVRAVQEAHGPESFAFLSTGQITSEEMALLGGVAKLELGMVHGDGNTRQCMASAVSAYKESFGFDAPPYTYADFEESDVIVLWGANPCVAHPIMWQRVCNNRRDPTIVVIDPRRTETAMAATEHLPLRPSSDLVLAYGVARVLVDRGWLDEDFIAAHTAGFDGFRRHLDAYPLERVAAETDLAPQAIERLARAIGTGGRVSQWWTMGINQSHQGVRTAQAIIDLALMTGNIGQPGTGANSITGQCNAMGSRLFSNTSSLYAGRDFASADDRREVAGILGVDPDRIPQRPSLAYDEILAEVTRGAIKGLWIIATNTAHSWINQGDLEEVWGKLDLLVVQDLFATTETAARADIVLPAAGWGEKEGTFVNSERRVGRVRRVAPSPGEALSDFAIFRLVAEYAGAGERWARWRTPREAFDVLRELTRGRACDISGVDYELLDARGGVQWPYPDAGADDAVERRLFADGRFYHPDGRARFVWDEPRSPRELPSSRYPFVLLTGRGSASQWHTQTRTRTSAVLESLHPSDVYVEIHPDDARRLGVRAGRWVRVATARGAIHARAVLTHAVGAGRLFVPMHYRTTNVLTFPAFDPHSRQPAYKSSAASVRPLARWEGPS